MTIRKTLSLVLALVMVCSLVVAGVYADETADPTLLPNLGKAPQIAGDVTGVPTDAVDVTYLSDLHNSDDSLALNDRVVDQLNNKIVLDSNYNGSPFVFVEGSRKQIKDKYDAGKDYRSVTKSDGSVVTFSVDEIVVGFDGMKFEKGLGVHPDAAGKDDRYIVYNVKGLGNHFYAIAGATGSNVTDPATNVRRVIFELWGSKADEYSADAEFEKLAHVDSVRAYVLGQFNLDITGYNYIKLVVKMDPTSTDNSSCAVVWADAALYNEPSEEPSEEPTEEPSEEPTKAPLDPNKASSNYKPNSNAGLSSDKAATASDLSVNSLVAGSYIYPASGSTDPRPVNVDAGFKGAALAIGGNTYTDGFGLHPSPASDATESYVLLDVSNVKGNRFYSMVGITGNAKNNTEQGVVFRVYGGNSVDGEFTLLASSGGLYGTSTGEFDVYIGDYKYLKLELDSFEGDHSSRAAAWVNPCIYEGNPGTADTFSALPVALLVLSGIAVVAMVAKKKED